MSDCPETATDTDGVIVPCVFSAGHEGEHRFIRIAGVQHICGNCGEEFQISDSDPHWSTGRGPICPKPLHCTDKFCELPLGHAGVHEMKIRIRGPRT